MKPNTQSSENPKSSSSTKTGKVSTPTTKALKRPVAKKAAKCGSKSDIPSCVGCKTGVNDETCALNCDGCGEVWKCTTCLGIDEDTYDLLVYKASSLKWLCEKCDNAVSNREVKMPDKVMEILEELLQRSKTIEQRLSYLESILEQKADKVAVSELERRIESVENRIATDEAERKLLNERLEKEAEKKMERNQDLHIASEVDITGNVELSLKEMQDRNRRKENLVLFNVPESTSEDRDERKLYDISEVIDILKDLKIDTTVLNPVRLGLNTVDHKYPRPLRIAVPDEDTKWKIVKEAKNLMSHGKEYHTKVFIKRDMTPMEREQDAATRKKLMEMRNQEEAKGGKDRWIIWRGKVVKKRN